MKLGAFSISLNVKDLDASQKFYETLGFAPAGGDPAQGWLILRNEQITIGLFKGMFDTNMMTFNPGWSADAQPLDAFDDVRDIQAALRAEGAPVDVETAPDGVAPAHIVTHDPDGNVILIDQHVPKPEAG